MSKENKNLQMNIDGMCQRRIGEIWVADGKEKDSGHKIFVF